MRGGNHLVEAKFGYQDVPYQLYPNQRMDMTGNDSHQFNLRYQGNYAWGQLQARAYHEKTRHSMNYGEDKQYWYGPTGNVPGMPRHTGHTCVFGGAPKAVGQPQKIFVRVSSCAWISRPMTGS